MLASKGEGPSEDPTGEAPNLRDYDLHVVGAPSRVVKILRDLSRLSRACWCRDDGDRVCLDGKQKGITFAADWQQRRWPRSTCDCRSSSTRIRSSEPSAVRCCEDVSRLPLVEGKPCCGYHSRPFVFVDRKSGNVSSIGNDRLAKEQHSGRVCG